MERQSEVRSCRERGEGLERQQAHRLDRRMNDPNLAWALREQPAISSSSPGSVHGWAAPSCLLADTHSHYRLFRVAGPQVCLRCPETKACWQVPLARQIPPASQVGSGNWISLIGLAPSPCWEIAKLFIPLSLNPGCTAISPL